LSHDSRHTLLGNALESEECEIGEVLPPGCNFRAGVERGSGLAEFCNQLTVIQWFVNLVHLRCRIWGRR
jgi:hypothetical protein